MPVVDIVTAAKFAVLPLSLQLLKLLTFIIVEVVFHRQTLFMLLDPQTQCLGYAANF